MSGAAWNSLGGDDYIHVVTQLYLHGAVDIGASLLDGNRLGLSGSFAVDSIYEILERLSLVKLNALAQTGVFPLKFDMTSYNVPPLTITLKKVPE